MTDCCAVRLPWSTRRGYDHWLPSSTLLITRGSLTRPRSNRCRCSTWHAAIDATQMEWSQCPERTFCCRKPTTLRVDASPFASFYHLLCPTVDKIASSTSTFCSTHQRNRRSQQSWTGKHRTSFSCLPMTMRPKPSVVMELASTTLPTSIAWRLRA